LPELTAAALRGVSATLESLQPDVVLAQGDTTTVLVSALASFYAQIPMGHVEAGLRTRDRYSPFPEEMNRRLVGSLATLHFAPTQTAVDALLAEGVAAGDVHLTGNTVVDALRAMVQQPYTPPAALRSLQVDAAHKRIILVTAHRRENFGAPFESLCDGLLRLVQRNPDLELVYPVHLNPNVRDPVFRILGGQPRIHLLEPVAYPELVYLLQHCTLVLTDSGGIQEEAPVLGKPVLVMRRETERPEGIAAGTARLVGTDSETIVREAERLLHDPGAYQAMAQAVSPYGDGHAAARIVHAVWQRFGQGVHDEAGAA
jgi:UDP-N-acetylglucosamine 2-epimerase (non-hydrolysing)